MLPCPRELPHCPTVSIHSSTQAGLRRAPVWHRSIRTPLVAALVQEAFPWMDGHGLPQTLLTTVTDVGAPGVDAVFGWGLVNGDRAVKEPAWFGDTFVADLGAEDGGVFGNDIGGPGGLLKTGNGRLTLSGQNTYAGATRVQAGTLLLDGRVGGDVVVEDGARFASRGAHWR